MAITKASSSAVAPAAKGDLVVGNATNDSGVLAVGANDTVLTADSSTATGLKWAAPAGGSSNFVLLNAGGTDLVSAQTITVSGISNKSEIYAFISGASSVNAGATMWFTINTDTGANYLKLNGSQTTGQITTQNNIASNASNLEVFAADNENIACSAFIHISNANSINYKPFEFFGAPASTTGNSRINGVGFYQGTSAVTSISFNTNQANFDAGKIFVYTTA